MGTRAADGRVYSNWYPLNSAVALPLVALGRTAGKIVRLPELYAAAPFAAATTVLVTACGVLAVWALALAFGGTRRDALFASLTYAFGTVLLFYGRTFFADPLLALIVTGGALGAVDASRDDAGRHAIPSALAIVAKPTGVVLGAGVAVWHAFEGRWRNAALAAAGTACGLAAYGWYNWVRFGDPATFGQRWGGFTTCCVPEAVTGLLVSPGRGLFVYSPVLLLGLVGAVVEWRRPAARLVCVLVAGFIAVHAVWGEWQGGWSWGSRLMVPTIGILCAALVWAPVPLRRLAPALAVAGFLLNAPTLVWSFHEYNAAAAERHLSDRQMVWQVQDSQLVQAWPMSIALLARARPDDVRDVVRRAGSDDASSRSEVFQVIPVWWWLAPAVRLPMAATAAIAAALAAGGVWLLRSAWQLSAPGADGDAI